MTQPMPDNQPVEVTEANLREMTNQFEGAPMMQPTESAPQEEGAPVSPEAMPDQPQQNAPQEKGKAFEEALAEYLKDTPFKSVDELKKSYKEIQGEYTRVNQKVKPYEQLLSDLNDPQFANFVDQARALYKNPHLAQAYTQPQASMPDPRLYNLYDEKDVSRYNQDVSNFMAQQLDSRLNSRLSQIEQQNRLNDFRRELKSVYPDADPDEVEKFLQSKGNDWKYTDIYKVMHYDNLKSKLTDEIRKELTKQMEEAGKQTTPQTSTAQQGKPKAEDIIDYIAKRGLDAAKGKYGSKVTMDVVRQYS